MHVFWLLLLLTWLALGLEIFSIFVRLVKPSRIKTPWTARWLPLAATKKVVRVVKIGWNTNFHGPQLPASWDLVMSIPLWIHWLWGIWTIYWFEPSTFPEVDEISLPSLWSEQGSPEILEAAQQGTWEGNSSYRQQASWLSLHITPWDQFLNPVLNPISLCKSCPLESGFDMVLVDACNFWRWWCTKYQSCQGGESDYCILTTQRDLLGFWCHFSPEKRDFQLLEVS